MIQFPEEISEIEDLKEGTAHGATAGLWDNILFEKLLVAFYSQEDWFAGGTGCHEAAAPFEFAGVITRATWDVDGIPPMTIRADGEIGKTVCSCI